MEPLKDTNAQVIVKKISGSIPVEEMPYLPTKKKDINQDTENIKVSAMDVKEIVVRAEQTPGQVSFYNFEELKEYISYGLAVYNNTVYTPENLNQAERDLKVLRAVKKKLYDKKKELEEAYSLPIETVKAQIDELINMVKEPMNIIDNIVKENRKLAKKNEIMEYARRKSDILGEYADGVLESQYFFNNRWLNASYKEKDWKSDIDEIVQKSVDTFEEIEQNGGDNKSTLRAFYLEKLSMDGADRFIKVATENKEDDKSDNQTVQDTKIESDKSPIGYKVLKIYGTKSQMLKIMRSLDDMQMQYEEIENGMN